MPTSERRLVVVDLGITSQWQIFVKKVCDGIPGAAVGTAKLGYAVSALGHLVLNVMAHQCAEFQIALSGNFRKVVLPNKQVFMVLPRCLVPKCGITVGAPVCGQAYSGCFRENRRKL